MKSIQAIGAYVPRLRLARSAMSASLGWLSAGAGSGKGARALAFWDEDSVTMAVAAARRLLRGRSVDAITSLAFATTTAPFAEPQNASLIRAALRLPSECLTHDVQGTPRAALLAVHAALEAGATAVVAAGDLPRGAAGSLIEARAGDAGAAVLIGSEPGLLNYLGGASLSAPFVDRYRATTHGDPLEWEERWVREEGYLDIVPQAIESALARAGLAASDIDHLVLPCPIAGVAAAIASRVSLTNAEVADSLAETCGNTGAAHALLMLANALGNMAPGEKVVVAQMGQGATALVFEAGVNVAAKMPEADFLAHGIVEQNYMKLLAYRERLEWDRGLRGRFIVNEALSTAWRNSEALLGFIGGRCRQSGNVHFPPSRLSEGDGLNLDSQVPWPLADRGGRVATFTADLLAFSPSPPNCYGLVDFDGGGRLLMEFTDPQAADITPDTPVEFTFRIKDADAQSGYRRYFWKAVATPRAT